MSNKTQNI